MGIVYLAEDPTLSRKVALKVLYPSLLTDTGFLARFRTEAQSIAALESPYIVRINSMNESEEGQVAIDMEYVDGGVVAPQLNNPIAIARVAFHTLEGLGACHRLGVIHRDIKPNNLLVSSGGITKIADFGLATAFSDHVETSIARGSSSGFFMGTPRYAPPEAWEGGAANPTWDLYSLGMVLYEGVTKRTVYDGLSPLAIAKQISAAPPAPVREFAPTVSKEFGALINRMVSHDPKVRPQNVDEALACLNESSEFKTLNLHEPPTVRVSRPISINTRSSRMLRRLRPSNSRRALVGLFVLVFVASLFFVAMPALDYPEIVPLAVESSGSGIESLASPRIARTAVLGGTDYRWRDQPTIFVGNDLEQDQSGEYVWLVNLAPESGGESAFLCWEYGVGSISLIERGPDTYMINGNWAAYREPTGRSLQIGSLSGTLQLTAEGTQMVVSLEWNDDRSRLHWGSVQTLTRSTDDEPTGEYWLRMEDMELVQPLIYTELIPRSLSWASEIESNFGSSKKQRAIVPILRDAVLPSLDGELVEEIWQLHYYDDNGRIGGLPFWNAPDDSQCILRFLENSLCIGIQTPSPTSSDFRLNLSIAPSLVGAMSEMPTYHQIWSDSNRTETRMSLGNREAPWNSEWKLVSVLENGQWQCEIVIPFIEIVPDVSELDDRVFRVNLALEFMDERGAPTWVANIGSKDVGAVEHGAVIRLTDEYESN